ncbi:MAG: acyl-CoA dehydrogenase family protein [Kibdelosporangium sp.]
MRFALSSEQVQFAETLAALLAKSDAARAWPRGDHAPGLKVWRQLEDLGVTTLAQDGSPIDVVVAMEAIGYHALPGPAIETIAVVPGQGLVTVAIPPHVPYAVDADVAEPFLIQDGTLWRAEPGVQVKADRRLFELKPAGSVGPAPVDAFDNGALACAAQLLGAGRALLTRTVEYARQRTQFGKPIGGYQAVKHHLASTHIALELARPLVYAAAIGEIPVSAAKVKTTEAATQAARTALQVHGAIGYTQENDLNHWLTMVRTLSTAWGTTSLHRSRLMAALT